MSLLEIIMRPETLIANLTSMLQRALKTSVSPLGRTFLLSTIIGGCFLYLIYTKVQRVKLERHQRNRRRRHQESKRLAAAAKRKVLTPEERYLKGKAGTLKVLLAAEVIFEDTADDKKDISFREGVSAKLNTMCAICDVFIVVKQEETKEQVALGEATGINRRILSAFKKAGITVSKEGEAAEPPPPPAAAAARGFQKHPLLGEQITHLVRIVVCSTSSGKGHIARHILPHLYMDVELEPLKMVCPFIQDTILIGAKGSDKVKAFPSLVDFLTPISMNKSDTKAQNNKHRITSVRQRTKKIVTMVSESNKE
eukprot:jgi/Bigna1/137531/aug1.39_g12239